MTLISVWLFISALGGPSAAADGSAVIYPLRCLQYPLSEAVAPTKLLEMRAEYLGEHAGMSLKFPGRAIRYLSTQERPLYEPILQDGFFFDRATELPFNAKKIFVLSKDGKLYIGTKVPGHFHHSSLVNGDSVKAAGSLFFENGKLIRIDDSSGHYRPTRKHMLRFLNYLESRGVDVSKVKKDFH